MVNRIGLLLPSIAGLNILDNTLGEKKTAS